MATPTTNSRAPSPSRSLHFSSTIQSPIRRTRRSTAMRHFSSPSSLMDPCSPSTPPPPASSPVVPPSTGDRITVWWDDRQIVFTGKVLRQADQRTWLFEIAYDDGDCLQQDLDTMPWRLLAKDNSSWVTPGTLSADAELHSKESHFVSPKGTRRSKRLNASSKRRGNSGTPTDELEIAEAKKTSLSLYINPISRRRTHDNVGTANENELKERENYIMHDDDDDDEGKLPFKKRFSLL